MEALRVETNSCMARIPGLLGKPDFTQIKLLQDESPGPCHLGLRQPCINQFLSTIQQLHDS